MSREEVTLVIEVALDAFLTFLQGENYEYKVLATAQRAMRSTTPSTVPFRIERIPTVRRSRR